jgi:Ni/Fe-hydrogenase 1 B-type cytochrome subunit
MSDEEFSVKVYSVWDRSIRVFHWLNVICVTGLIFVGVAILYSKNLGVSSDGKILLKTVHVYIGYVFAVNLVWRWFWMWVGSRYSKWYSFFPYGKIYVRSFFRQLREMKTDKTAQYAGHTPIGRLMVSILLILLTGQAITGLVLAGTDLYFPPFGGLIADWVAISSEDSGFFTNLKPGFHEKIDEASFKEMREFRKLFIETHVFVFYALLAAIFVHIAAVVIIEIKEKSNLISAMITGKKKLNTKPVDSDDC